MSKFGKYLLLATGFAILAIVGTLTNGTSKALADSDTFTTIDFPGASRTDAFGINPRGDIVGAYTSSGVGHGFLLSGGEFTTIDFPGASFTNARGINPRGDIVGAYTSSGVSHGYLLSRGQFSTIDFAGASLTEARGINARGDIVGDYCDAAPCTLFTDSDHSFLLSREERDDHGDDQDFSFHTSQAGKGGKMRRHLAVFLPAISLVLGLTSMAPAGKSEKKRESRSDIHDD